ncbi:hypothetical protein NC652_031220 [Populus alba x Populus x berolinensis]|nr:hypothetical protein NC652_031220 [Populus alba x Populus x berolinensis]
MSNPTVRIESGYLNPMAETQGASGVEFDHRFDCSVVTGEGERDEMGIDAMRIRVQIRRFLVISFELCYRSVCKHPFLVGMVCFLLLLYRSFPFLFSLLVTASPVLICTAILLGTLLSFWRAPNIPEVEEEEEGRRKKNKKKKEGTKLAMRFHI